MALDTILGLNPADPGASVLAHAVGTPLVALHKDLATATLLPLEPYSVVEERNPTNAQKHCIIRNNKALPWIELYPVVATSNVPTAGLKGRLFGFVPDVPEMANAQTNALLVFGNGRRMPQDLDPSNYDDTLQGVNPDPRSSESNPSLAKRERGHWLPCKALGASAPGLLTFNNTEVARQTDTANSRKEIHVFEPIICYAAGMRDFMFTVSAPFGIPVTAAMLLARFTS